MTKLMEAKECFDLCNDDDIPFIEDGFNYLWRKTKKELLKSADQGMQLGTMLESSISDKWQIQRMYLCQGCGKYFKSEDCESISGSGTFNCDECNHPEEPNVLTFEESEAKYWIIPGVLDEKGYWRRGYKTGFGDGDQNGKLAEYQRPEQIDLRKGIKDFLIDMETNSEDHEESETLSLYRVKLKSLLENLKPPTDTR